MSTHSGLYWIQFDAETGEARTWRWPVAAIVAAIALVEAVAFGAVFYWWGM